MQLTKLGFLLASAFAICAHPLDGLNKRGDYSCRNAYDDCQGSNRGQYVCWANDNNNEYGNFNGGQLKGWGNDPLSNHCSGEVYCCDNNPFVDINVNVLDEGNDVNVNVNVEVTLSDNCNGYQMHPW